MGEGWWLASDGKWYPRESHPDGFHEAPTRETPATSQGSATGPGLAGPGAAAGFGPPTVTNPVVPGGPVEGPKNSNRGPLVILVVVLILVAALAGGCVAFVLSSRQGSSDDATAPAENDLAPPTTSELDGPTGTLPEFSPEPGTPSTSPEESVPETTTTTTTSLVPAPPGTEPQRAIMPEVVCMDLQQAQDTIQAAGVFFSRSFDATGAGRNQIVDRNWIVVSQDPPAGSPIDEREPNLGAVKKNEPSPC